MSIPENFLKQLEQYSELSHREKEVFLEIFGRSKNRIHVAQELNISESNLSTCLTGIYKKFCITGNGPVKESRLREYLNKRYSQQKPSGHLTTDDVDDSIDTLVQEIRKQIKPYIKEKCGTMRVLDMRQPIKLTGKQGIYTNVNILEEITGRKRLKIAELLQNCDPDNFERFGLRRVKEKRVSGLKAVQSHSKLMVLGKPGAGKTTFLKYLAMQCIEGHFQESQVPLFITLKDFAEVLKQPDILEYIAQQFSSCGVTDTRVKTEQLLRQGRALVLLDGLDEVREEDTKRVLRQIREMSDQFHNNKFVITCRIAAKEYTFEHFTEVEVADFDKEQIAIFVQNWFQFMGQMQGERFIQKLKKNKPIQELATNPLLLTLLCLVFGESNDFPINRSELYKEGLDVLLKKWDAKRNIERDQVYKNLSLQRKEDLLSQIALITFEQKDYFFKQKTVEVYIAEFIRNLRDADTGKEALRLDSEAVLKSIEAQHGLLVERAKGIYSFSHLTFQEYFTAREIVANSAWESIVEHITDKRWHEVFLLTTEMMRRADELIRLMKQKIDELYIKNPQIHLLLAFINQKSNSIETHYKPVAVRAFYFGLSHIFTGEISFGVSFDSISLVKSADFNLGIPFAYNKERKLVLIPQLNLEIANLLGLSKILIEGNRCTFDYFLAIAYALTFTCEDDEKGAFNLATFLDLYRSLSIIIEYAKKFDIKLQLVLVTLKQQLPDPDKYQTSFLQWWKESNQDWVKHIRNVILEYFGFDDAWKHEEETIKLFRQYYYTNKLLIDCLNSDCYISQKLREEIENTLLLPFNI
ncbi:NACHT domain-containing NTPase [Nostoc edaphicum CCNP1411]|uniref:NACHT domain-containing NTPase n=1 Tax=Nostoc edaphicum CCNP1411 TaxID=1472755 RepID=A0A7D7LCM6_9NOSO|nr:NACHT domain-containing NTPase [Nostoc edaphicum]QMS90073.1 NACHT domain-containing NTPase [Nostoc edaphicum CCNP1411]